MDISDKRHCWKVWKEGTISTRKLKSCLFPAAMWGQVQSRIRGILGIQFFSLVFREERQRKILGRRGGRKRRAKSAPPFTSISSFCLMLWKRTVKVTAIPCCVGAFICKKKLANSLSLQGFIQNSSWGFWQLQVSFEAVFRFFPMFCLLSVTIYLNHNVAGFPTNPWSLSCSSQHSPCSQSGPSMSNCCGNLQLCRLKSGFLCWGGGVALAFGYECFSVIAYLLTLAV